MPSYATPPPPPAPTLPPYGVRQWSVSKITGLYILKCLGLQRSPQHDMRFFLAAVQDGGGRFFRNTGGMLSNYTVSHSTRNLSQNSRSLDRGLNTPRSHKKQDSTHRRRQVTSCANMVLLRGRNELNRVCEVFVFPLSEVQPVPSLWERLFSVLCSNHDSSERSLA
jgi:hypothetical protein